MSMICNLFLVNDRRNAITKTLNNKLELNINLKGIFDRTNPMIILQFTDIFEPKNYNYCQLDNRYYFINKIEYVDNKNVALYLSLDYFTTFKRIILNNTHGVIDRSGSNFNRYINDENLVLANQKRVQTKKFLKSFKANNNAILIVTSD